MKKKLLTLLFPSFCIILGVTTIISCSKSKSEQVILRLGMAGTSNTPQPIEMGKLAERFNKRAGPYYKMEFYCCEQLVPMMESLDAVRTGAAEMMNFPVGGWAGNDCRLGACEVPFILNNVEANTSAAPKIIPIYSKVLEDKFNQKLLGAYQVTGLDLISRKPVKTLKDWDGLLVQSLSPQTAGLITSLGGSPVSIPFTEAYSALQKGVVDAVLTAPTAMLAFKLQEIAHYATATYFIPAIMTITINLDVWDDMPENIQSILAEEVQKSADTLSKEVMIPLYYNDLNNLSKAGVKVYYLPKPEREKWKKKTQPFVETLLLKMGEVGENVKKIAQTANKNNPYKY